MTANASNASSSDPTPDQVELRLQQLDSLPTLGAVAVRVLEVTSNDASQAKEVAALIGSDPALAARVLKLARCDVRARSSNIPSIDRAVVLLGFDAVRSAVLSVQVFDMLESEADLRPGTADPREDVFDRAAFWRHCIATAEAAQAVARRRDGEGPPVDPNEAFIAGLLHDVGALALHLVAPDAFGRACRMADTGLVPLDQACRRQLGIDAAAAGKRLAERWGLPARLIDAIWLHGQPAEASSLAEDSAGLVAAVTAGDALARHQHLAPAGQPPLRGERFTSAVRGVGDEVMQEIAGGLHPATAARAEALGLDEPSGDHLLLRSIQRANEVLGQLNISMQHQADAARLRGCLIDEVGTFLDEAARASAPTEMLGCVVRSVRRMGGGEVFVAWRRSPDDGGWTRLTYASSGRLEAAEEVSGAGWSDVESDAQLSREALRDASTAACREAWVVHRTDRECVVLAHDATFGPETDAEGHSFLGRAYRTAMASSEARALASRRSERLAAATRALAAQQEEVARHRALATLGEVAAGAAHEMNNPLTVICGRSQVLAARLEGDDRETASQIAEQASQLSDMITQLRRVAEPASPNLSSTAVAPIVRDAAARVPGMPSFTLESAPDARPIPADPEQLAVTIEALLRNAAESPGCTSIRVTIDRWKIVVTDDGSGLSEHEMQHAFDPFFSSKPAGRQPGLGLAVARRYVDGMGGRIELENGPDGGASATIWFAPEHANPMTTERGAA